MKLKSLLLLFTLSTFTLNIYAQLNVVPNKTDNSTTILDLNGSWKFNSSYKGSINTLEAKGQLWKNIEVPGEWTMQGFSVEPGQQGVYYRTFDIPKEWKNYNVFLRCDAVFSKAEIAVNGKQVATHIGPLVAFERNLTDVVRFGKNNEIAMGITAETMADTLMSGTQYAAHQLGGILRKIYLYAVPKVHLSGLKITTSFDEDYKDATLIISGELKNYSAQKDAEIQFRLFNPEGAEVNLGNSIVQIDLNSEKQKSINYKFTIENPVKWDAEHPNLYKLELTIKSKSGTEFITKQIGFRQIEVVGNQLFVNRKTY